MKKIVLTLIFLFIFFLPFLNRALYDSHDGEAHLARFAAYYQAFEDGQFPPRWAGNLNFGYGTPVFIFYYPLSGYLASVIHSLGINYENAFKILMITGYVLAPLFCYLWLKTFFKKEVAIAGGILYGFAPYHLLDLYVRGDIAEIIAFAFIPLVFLFIERAIKHKQIPYFLIAGLFYALLILSHNGLSLMFSPVLLLYIIMRSKNKKIFFSLLMILVLGLLLSSYFWLPALWEGKYVNTKLFIGSMYKNHFPTIFELFYSSWGFGADVRKIGGLSPQIGIFHALFALIGILIFVKEKKKNYLLGSWIIVFLFAVFISTVVSGIIWENVSMLRLFEFPWRFTALSSFAATIITCYVLQKLNKTKLVMGIIALFLLTSIPFTKVSKYLSRNDRYYEKFNGTTYYHGEASPVWTAGDPNKFAKSQIEIIAGKGEINNLVKKSNLHRFDARAIDTISLVDNTQYFPGWIATVDGHKVPIQFQDPNHRGLITFSVPQGKHEVAVRFIESPVRFLANMASIIGFIILFGLFIYTKQIEVLYNKVVRKTI